MRPRQSAHREASRVLERPERAARQRLPLPASLALGPAAGGRALCLRHIVCVRPAREARWWLLPPPPQVLFVSHPENALNYKLENSEFCLRPTTTICTEIGSGVNTRSLS
ncbi:Hypothetical predicted protein [Podarcis lilfordi]|uniref:Uncharacterized protein n=1 Tax=Podarcis lilfordi TaxID=74358 RepID=A0AA35KJ60_9SAUR|nr:Hypothetical predicted protein [Podarcis lilfordi]